MTLLSTTDVRADAGDGSTRPHTSTCGFEGLSVLVAELVGGSAPSIAGALERMGASVRVASSRVDTRRHAGGSPPDAVVVVAPTIAGSTRDDVRELSRHGPVLVLSTGATTRERIAVWNSGADIVLATVGPDEVVAALAAVLRRTRTSAEPDAERVVHAGGICVDRSRRTATAAGRALALTPLEFDLLAYLVTHAEEALSRDRLLRDVWGYDIGGRDTVTVHIRRLRRKIEADPAQPTLLLTVWGIGYRLAGYGERQNCPAHGSVPLRLAEV